MAKKTTSSPELTEEFKKTLEMTKLLDVEVEEELKARTQTYFILDARAWTVLRQGVQKVRPYRRRLPR